MVLKRDIQKHGIKWEHEMKSHVQVRAGFSNLNVISGDIALYLY